LPARTSGGPLPVMQYASRTPSRARLKANRCVGSGDSEGRPTDEGLQWDRPRIGSPDRALFGCNSGCHRCLPERVEQPSSVSTSIPDFRARHPKWRRSARRAPPAVDGCPPGRSTSREPEAPPERRHQSGGVRIAWRPRRNHRIAGQRDWWFPRCGLRTLEGDVCLARTGASNCLARSLLRIIRAEDEFAEDGGVTRHGFPGTWAVDDNRSPGDVREFVGAAPSQTRVRLRRRFRTSS
jgi:hypothetical protein